MPSLLYYLRRAGEQPLRETLNQAQSLFSDRARMILQPRLDRMLRRPVSAGEILVRCGFGTSQDMAAHFKSRKAPEFPQSILDSIEADMTLPCAVDLPWHTDTKSGYTWDTTCHYRRIPLRPRPGVDIKVPWDFSRSHHIVSVAAAYRDTSDEKYAVETVRRINSWIAENPYRYGVNWVNAMEAGIRAVNWIAAFFLIRRSRAADEDFVQSFITSLFHHAVFIRDNLEYRECWIDGARRRLNSNHYLCDLLGMLYIATLFPELRLGHLARFAGEELKIELLDQTTKDGVDWEHSTCYHRFVLDILKAALLLDGSQNTRVDDMEGFAAACLHPDGSMPQIGDNDGGRLFPVPVISLQPETRSRGFERPGFYSMRGIDTHVLVAAAEVGMNGFGSHSHNDTLSFEYWHGGRAWIVDPGTHVYLSDPESRNWFRSTEAHNTVRVDVQEINRFHPEAIFQMVADAKVKAHEWQDDGDHNILDVEHSGYERLNPAVRHRRIFKFLKGSGELIIRDVLDGAGDHLFEWFFQLHPEVSIFQDAPSTLTLRSGERKLRLVAKIPLSIHSGWYSAGYGQRQPTNRIVASHRAAAPFDTVTVIEPC